MSLTSQSTSHLGFSDEEFLQQFLDFSFPPDLFNHEAHLRYSWICFQKYPLLEALRLICEGIRAYDLHHGSGKKYHLSISLAFGLLVYERISKSGKTDWDSFIQQNPDLISDWRGLLYKHYAHENLFSDQAAVNWTFPDKHFPSI